jgi:hypothetical protein
MSRLVAQEVAETQAKAGLRSDAEVTFGEARDAAYAVEDPMYRAGALADIVAAEAHAKMLAEARSSFNQAQQILLDESGAGERRWSELLRLARRQMEAGFVDDAQVTFAPSLEGAGHYRNSGTFHYLNWWISITQTAVGRLITESDARSRRQLLQAADAIDDVRHRAQVLRTLAELEPAP